MTAIDVITGRRRWAVEKADAIDWLDSLPDDSLDLLLTSPPYEAARSYSMDFNKRGQEWVDWMVAVIKAASPKVTGLMAIVAEGQTRKYSYSATPFLLMADLKRAGFTLRKPPVYHRVGIPGSGGPDWLKNNYELIVCVTRPGRLPWSDPVATGNPPKFPPGGRPSHRLADGSRANGKTGKDYVPPALANPGNVIDCGAAGGGNMGHELASENEAPFKPKLAEFFVKSFCPPDGIAADCFAGSGTVAHAAMIHGRRSISCDLRESQVMLTQRRLRDVEEQIAADRPQACQSA